VAAGNVGDGHERAAMEPYLESADDLLREHAEWAASRLAERGGS
jgi:hypothetical protein